MAHEIADLHRRRADAAVDRCGDGAIAELNFQIFQQALVGFDGRGVDLGLGLGVIEIDHRGCVLGDQVGVADDVAHSAGKLRAVAGDGALGLRDLRFDGAAVEGEQGVALLDLGAVAEMHGGDRGIDPRLDGDAGDRRDVAKRIRSAQASACARRWRLRPAPRGPRLASARRRRRRSRSRGQATQCQSGRAPPPQIATFASSSSIVGLGSFKGPAQALPYSAERFVHHLKGPRWPPSSI